MLRALNFLFKSLPATFETTSVVLGVLLTVSTFIFVLEGSQDRLIAAVSAILAAVSPGIIVGINAGLIANWLALGLAFLFLGSMLRTLRTRGKAEALISYVILACLILTHAWTFAFIIVLLIAFALFSLLTTPGRFRRKILDAEIIFVIVVAGVLTDLARGALSGGPELGLAYSTLSPGVSAANVVNSLSNLHATFTTFLLGALANPTWFILGTVGVLNLNWRSGKFALLLFSWLFLTSFAVVLLSPSSITLLQARVIYDIPIQIFAAIGIVSMIRKAARIEGLASSKPLASLAGALFVIGTVALLLGFALNVVGVLYPPPFLR